MFFWWMFFTSSWYYIQHFSSIILKEFVISFLISVHTTWLFFCFVKYKWQLDSIKSNSPWNLHKTFQGHRQHCNVCFSFFCNTYELHKGILRICIVIFIPPIIISKYILAHPSEKRDFCLVKCSSKTLKKFAVLLEWKSTSFFSFFILCYFIFSHS